MQGRFHRIFLSEVCVNYCEDVKNALEETGITTKCIHYQTKAEKEFESFSPARVHQETAEFIGKAQYKKILEETIGRKIL